MGKIDIAFDRLENIKKVNELSVVLYPDSFFYGLWDENEVLIKTDSHSISNFSKLLNIWKKNYSFNIARILSSVKPFVHLPADQYQKKHFKAYFNNVYKIDKRKSSKKDTDDFLREEIKTLHYLEKTIVKQLNAFKIPYKSAHISTALANYSFLIESDLICYMHGSLLHICYAKNGEFKLYNQFYCETAEDYLYYILWVMKHFGLDPSTEPIHMGGMVNTDSPVMKLVQAYIKNINVIDQNVKLPKNHDISKQYYYDLYLCKSCV